VSPEEIRGKEKKKGGKWITGRRKRERERERERCE
jgi:hypothetical protein